MSLQAAESRFKHIFDLIGDPAVEFKLVDNEPIVEGVNPAFVKTFGYEREDIIGESLNEYIVPETETDEAAKFDQRTKSGECNSAEVTRITASGPRDFLYRGVPYERQDQAYGFAIYTDITERNEREAELKEYKQELEASNEKLERFAYIASHDLQEPLRMISSYIDLLEAQLGDELDEDARENMEFVSNGADRMREMIDGLLTYSRVQTEADPFEVVEPNDILDEVRQDLEIKIEGSNATVDFGNLPTVTADRNQLGQLFQNLLKNAIEHGGDSVRIEVTAAQHDETTEFSVADNGPGIPPYLEDDLFGIFDKGEDSDGTGIGLAVCKEIVDRHGGDIWVDSTVGDGTTFSFTIPEVPR
jgi:PAS domain S-box-containing protein